MKNFRLEDITFTVFFVAAEPLLHSFFPTTDLNKMTSTDPVAVSTASFIAVLLAWLCGLWPVRPVQGRPVLGHGLEEGARLFVFLYAFLVLLIGAEFLDLGVLATLGMPVSMGLYVLRFRWKTRFEALPPLPDTMRRILFLPYLVFLGMMIDALFVMPGETPAMQILRSVLLSVILFWILLFPSRLYIERAPFNGKAWLLRSGLFTLIMTVNTVFDVLR